MFTKDLHDGMTLIGIGLVLGALFCTGGAWAPPWGALGGLSLIAFGSYNEYLRLNSD